MDPSLKILPTHKYPLTISSRFVNDYCGICYAKGPICGGYRCNDPVSSRLTFFHKDCAEAPSEIINHPSHPQHPLKLHDSPGKPCICNLCGRSSFTFAYLCSSKCDFVLDLTCGINPLPLTIEYPKSHHHPVIYSEEPAYCEVCKSYTGISSYVCLKCEVHFHVDCVNLSQEVNHPSHPQHPLELLPLYKSLASDAEKTCLLCGEQPNEVLYRCSICNFNICRFCTKNPPPLAIEHHKTHEHQLVLLSRHISFECNACGTQGDRSPYMCVQCGFVVHRTCIDLPRVININRHDHRISLTYHLGVGYSKCGICRKDISQYHGAYSCSRCPNYAAHSLCATRKDVWDEVELEGVPEDNEDIEPFKVVGDNLIKHFSHEEHNLRLNKDNINRDEGSRCEACVLPIYSDPIYNCEECRFILHEKCANLPKKRRLVFDTKPFTLWTGPPTLHTEDSGYGDAFYCSACEIKSTGFRYISNRCVLDVRCGSLLEPVIHDGHKHPLYHEKRYNNRCDACHKEIPCYYGYYLLRCDACNFDLDMRCVNLPKVVKHSCDDHPLALCYGENATGKYWCEICEAKIDPSKWFYASDCGVTAHIECVLGDFSRLMPGRIIDYKRVKVEVVPNNRSSRPVCAKCHSRCRAPIILKLCDPFTGYICSHYCAVSYDPYPPGRWIPL